jgi:hypothetical protein
MERPTDIPDQITDTPIAEAKRVMDNAAAFDAAVDVRDSSRRAIHRFAAFCARECPASWLLGRHDELDGIERKRVEAETLEQPAARGSTVGGHLGYPIMVDAALVYA